MIYCADTSHELSHLIFWENYFRLLSAAFVTGAKRLKACLLILWFHADTLLISWNIYFKLKGFQKICFIISALKGYVLHTYIPIVVGRPVKG